MKSNLENCSSVFVYKLFQKKFLYAKKIKTTISKSTLEFQLNKNFIEALNCESIFEQELIFTLYLSEYQIFHRFWQSSFEGKLCKQFMLKLNKSSRETSSITLT